MINLWLKPRSCSLCCWNSKCCKLVCAISKQLLVPVCKTRGWLVGNGFLWITKQLACNWLATCLLINEASLCKIFGFAFQCACRDFVTKDTKWAYIHAILFIPIQSYRVYRINWFSMHILYKHKAILYVRELLHTQDINLYQVKLKAIFAQVEDYKP